MGFDVITELLDLPDLERQMTGKNYDNTGTFFPARPRTISCSFASISGLRLLW